MRLVDNRADSIARRVALAAAREPWQFFEATPAEVTNLIDVVHRRSSLSHERPAAVAMYLVITPNSRSISPILLSASIVAGEASNGVADLVATILR
jgi:hypothetical protein